MTRTGHPQLAVERYGPGSVRRAGRSRAGRQHWGRPSPNCRWLVPADRPAVKPQGTCDPSIFHRKSTRTRSWDTTLSYPVNHWLSFVLGGEERAGEGPLWCQEKGRGKQNYPLVMSCRNLPAPRQERQMARSAHWLQSEPSYVFQHMSLVSFLCQSGSWGREIWELLAGMPTAGLASPSSACQL